jgi:uncharacterized membrane protein YesL
MKRNHILTGILLCNLLVAFEGIKSIVVFRTIPGVLPALTMYFLPPLLWAVPVALAYQMRTSRFIVTSFAIIVVMSSKAYAVASAPKNVEIDPLLYLLQSDVLLLVAAAVALPFAYIEARNTKEK